MFYLLHSCITFNFPKLVIIIFIYSNCLSYLISAIMSSNNPIIALLANEKLSGDNFVKWKSNIKIVLICENQKFVLTEEYPPEPTAKASHTVQERYDSWIHSNNKTRYYMLASMNDVLRKKHEDMETAYEIWESLQAMFGQQSYQCLMKLFVAT